MIEHDDLNGDRREGMHTDDRAATRTLQQAAKVVALEEQIPRSPGVMLKDRPLLCAGAALVYEAARGIATPKELSQLAREMIALGSDHILKKAEEFGLDPALVSWV